MLGLLLFSVLSVSSVVHPAAPGVHKVVVGAYINDIQNLDIKSHSYSVDLYIWFRWKTPGLDPAAAFEFTNPYELWGHAKTFSFEKPVRLPGGEFYQVSRIQGRFSGKLRMDRYPFDRQDLRVEFEDSSRTEQELEFAADERGLAVNPALELPGYTLGRPSLSVQRHIYPTDFGDPRLAQPNAFSRVTVEIPVFRPVLTYGIKLILPVLCVFFCACLMFLLHPRHLDARAGIGITALLTIVALQITLNEDLPEIAYLILMDKVYLGTYLFVMAGLAVVMKTTWMHEAGDLKGALRVNRLALAACSGLYLAYAAGILLVNAL